MGGPKLIPQQVKGRGSIKRSQVFKIILRFAPKFIGNNGSFVIPANCMEPDWATHRGPREPSAMIIILCPSRKTRMSERAAGTALLNEEPRITE